MNEVIEELINRCLDRADRLKVLPSIEAEIKKKLIKNYKDGEAVNRAELNLAKKDKSFEKLLIDKDHLVREYLLQTQELKLLSIVENFEGGVR